MIFEELIKENKEALIAKVIDVSNYLKVKPEHLIFLMWFETPPPPHRPQREQPEKFDLRQITFTSALQLIHGSALKFQHGNRKILIFESKKAWIKNTSI